MVKQQKTIEQAGKISDPVTVLFGLVTSGILKNAQSVSAGRDQPELDRLFEGTRDIISFNNEYKKSPRYRAEFILRHLFEIEATIETALEELELEMKRSIWHSVEYTSETMTTHRTNLAALKSMVANLTPAHLTLQAHHYELLTELRHPRNGGELQLLKFFAPLCALRDEYFERPKAGQVLAYLTMSDELVEAYCLKYHLPLEALKEFKSGVSGYAATLEAMVLMEEIL